MARKISKAKRVIRFANRTFVRPFSYKLFIKNLYRLYSGKKLNLKNPQGFNEKLQWLKVYDDSPENKLTADKYTVRDYVREKLDTDEYFTELYGVYERPEDINWDALPQSFVIKCSHGSGYNIIVPDKSKLDIQSSMKKLEKWMGIDYYKYSGERQYRNTHHRILIEKFLSSEIVNYKFYCFYGKPEFLFIAKGDNVRGDSQELSFYNLDFTPAPFYNADFPQIQEKLDKPDNLDEMIRISAKLSSGHPFLRVDLFNVDGKIYFSELTLYTTSGFSFFSPPEYEQKLGEYIDLERFKREKELKI